MSRAITPQPPSYDSVPNCRLMGILDDLRDRLSENPPRLPSWIFVPVNSIPSILGAINYWIDTAKIAKTEKALEFHDPPDPAAITPQAMGMPGPVFPQPGNLGAYGDKLIRELASSALDHFTDQQLARTGLVPAHMSPNQARQYFEENKARFVDGMAAIMKTTLPSADTDVEVKWYKMTKTLPVPKGLEGRHPVLKQLLAAVRQGKDIPKALIDKVIPSMRCSVSRLTRSWIGTTGG